MLSLELLAKVVVLASILNINGMNALTIKCDYRKHPKSGCDTTAVCDQRLKQCICRIGSVLTAGGQCLRAKQVDEECVSSLQCRAHHSACLAVDGTYNSWKCQCMLGFWYETTSARCLERYPFGEKCHFDYQCHTGFVCSKDEANNDAKTVCKCPSDHRFNSTANNCQHFNNNGCPDGQTWNDHNNRCEPNHYSNRSGVEDDSKANAIVKNSKIIRPNGYMTQTSVAKDEDTDEKILEIILEISFLIVCLLAYQACSKACCPEDTDDDIDVKSDEESMISGTGSTPYTASAFQRHHKRVRKVFCKTRAKTTNSTQKLISSPIHNKYKNIIVKFDDSPTATARAQCYNCKIYKEVYSPGAKCKVCRASITANGLDPDMEYMSSDGKQLLPLPPYKIKPIRRSEEVGVPPHLKAPYVNNQPFWLK